jgi:predicted lipopolysaccharide heptosyltransferase III
MKILLIRLRQIGDVVFTTPAIRAVRRKFPEARITYLVEPAAAAVVDGNSHLDHILIAPLPRRVSRIREDVTLIRELRARRFDVAIDFHGGPRSSLLSWLSGARRRIGYDIAGRGWMYTDRVARPRELRPRHSVQNQWDLLQPLGIGAPDPIHDPTEMPKLPAAAARVDARLKAAGVQPSEPLVVIHVSAGNEFRRWPADSFEALIVSIATTNPASRIIVTSGPSDRDAAARIIERARIRLASRADRILASGDFDLAELRALLDRSALFIGGDSGPLHIAGTTGVAIVGLFGPTLPMRSAPWRDPRLVAETVDVGELPCRPCDQRRCVPGDFRCLTRLSPEAVFAAAERAMAASL